MDKFIKVVEYIQAYIISVPASSWYVLGSLIASMLATIGVTAWIKRRHLKKYADKLRSEFIVLNVTFWGFLSTVAAFVTTQGTNFAPFLPFLGTHWAQISGGAIAVHAISTALSKWWKERKENKPLAVPFPATLPDLIQEVQKPVSEEKIAAQPQRITPDKIQW